MKILEDLILDIYKAFIDDIGVKGPKSRYDDEEVIPSVRRFVLKYF